MTENGKYEALIKWLATSVFAQAPNNTDGLIDKHMKELYPELKTPSGDWGLYRLLDRAFTEQYISYQIRNDNGKDLKWYSATSRGTIYANELIKRENLYKNALKEPSSFLSDEVMDMVLYWFALEPKDYKGGLIMPRINVMSGDVGENITEFYFKGLNTVDFVINLDLILDQLAIDGNLYKNIDEGGRPKYSITYLGKKFMKNGGYRQSEINDISERKGKLLRERLEISGTWLAGIAASALVVVESIKYWKWFYSIELWTSFFLLLSCNLIGLIIWLLIRYLKESKNK